MIKLMYLWVANRVLSVILSLCFLIVGLVNPGWLLKAIEQAGNTVRKNKNDNSI